MNKQRHVIMQVVKNSGSATHHVEFIMDDTFAERLRQLRSLVPPLGTLNKQRDLVIDRVRVRMPSAVWRCGSDLDSQIDGSCIVVAADGHFNLGAKDRKSREKLVTYMFPIARLIELHVERPAGETFYIRDGVFANDEPAGSSAGRWMALMQDSEEMRHHEGSSDFDTLPGAPLMHSESIPMTMSAADKLVH
jgi:hypothetical protein